VQPSVLLSQLPQGLLDLAHRLRAVATGSAESPPGWGQRTPGQVMRWAGSVSSRNRS